jgi:hypothetical protein
MRYGFSLWLALTLIGGCSDSEATGGSGGDGGQGGVGGNPVACTDFVCPCTEAGIRAAITEGDGPFTFDCDGPTTVMTEAEIVIDKDVILDGQGDEGSLTVDGNDDHTVFSVAEGVTAELRRVTVIGGNLGIKNAGTLTLANSTVSGDTLGISSGNNVVTNSAVLTVINSTVSGRLALAFCSKLGTATIVTSTIRGGLLWGIKSPCLSDAPVTIMSSVLDNLNSSTGGCNGPTISNGYNIESPGDTCGFDDPTDQVNVSAGDLNLGPLQDNGGPTKTHALGVGSVAIDRIPPEDCVDADGQPLPTDQRGFTRPVADGCDVGAFEVQQ